MKYRIIALAVAALVGLLVGASLAAGTATAAPTTPGNPWPYAMTDVNSDGLVIEGSPGPNNSAILVKDHLGQPIFGVLEAGGAAVMGDNFRVLAGDDIYNAVITLSPTPPTGPCPKNDALWIASGNIWKCVAGTWTAPRSSLW